MKGYKQLSLKEREILFALMWQKAPLRTIGKALKRSHTTISREIRRNIKYGELYYPCQAHNYARIRLHQQRSKARLKDPAIYDYVVEKLKLKWSPEAIAGRLPIDYPGMSIHHESIYRYIYWDNGKNLHLWNYLTYHRPRRMKKEGRRVKPCSKIPDAISIDQRPQEVNEREISGHWETDNVIGRVSDKAALSTTVERVTRYTLLSRIKKSAEAKQYALVDRLRYFPERLKKTITTDNGAENANHKEITKMLSMLMYFCHAYHSWEKGSVENMNGRIRRYIPKGKSIDELTDAEVEAVEYHLNNTPRKCLGYLTPEEAMAMESGRIGMKKAVWYEEADQWMNANPL